MGTHDFIGDPRNEHVLVYVNGKMLPRDAAVVSVFDSGFLLGDGVWEGIRVQNGRLLFVDDHLDRLFSGAAGIALDIGKRREALSEAMLQTIRANQVTDDAHIRLVVSRGVKSTPFQSPRLTIGGPTIVAIVEHRPLPRDTQENGITLTTAQTRRGARNTQDPRWNSLSKLNCIAACIEAEKAGTDEALMLDLNGHVCTCNSTNFFMVKDGEVWTSTGEFCLPGITRSMTLKLCRENGIPWHTTDFDLDVVREADEAFVTGTVAGIVPAISLDDKPIGTGKPGPVTRRLQGLYRELCEREATAET